MAEILRLQQADLDHVRRILDAEAQEWLDALGWDRRPVNRTALALAARRALPGWLLVAGGEPAGKVLLGARHASRLLEFPYVAPAHRGRGRLLRLLTAAVAALQADPGVARIEVGLFPFGEDDPSETMARMGLRALPRRYMTRSAGPRLSGPGGRPGVAGVRLEPWRPDRSLPALLHSAYMDTPDRQGVELYATPRGCALYLEALRESPACGALAPALSAVAVDSRRRPVGFLLGTLVSPGTAHVAQVAVAPAWQGRCVGTTLLAHHLARAGEHGAPRSTLLVTTANTRARAWYARHGYGDGPAFLTYWWERPGPPVR